MSSTASVVVRGEGGVEIAGEGEDLGYSSCEGLDRAMWLENCVVVDDCAFRAILLVGECKRGGIGREEKCRVRVEWEDFAILPEFYVANSKLLGAAFGGRFDVGILADA